MSTVDEQLETAEVLAAHRWPSNAELIADVARLGYLCDTDMILDPTYGEGVWWKLWRPRLLICHDKYRGPRHDGVDFRRLPHDDGEFDAVAFDPPYVSVGGRDTSTIKGFQERYGLDVAPETRTARSLQTMIDDGIAECRRVLRPRGVMLVKCMSYVSSGVLWPGSLRTAAMIERADMEICEIFTHVGDVRAQPADRTAKHEVCEGRGCGMCAGSGRVPVEQQHARSNYSVLYVARASERWGSRLWA